MTESAQRSQHWRLRGADVVRRCDETSFAFRTTADLDPLAEGIIGQPRAVEAMEFGLAMDAPGYNVFMSGPVGTGKTTYAETKVRREALTRPTPSDWCCVYNFDEPDRPTMLAFPPGEGARFRRDMEEFVAEARSEIRRVFESEEYESRRLELIQRGDREAADIWKQLEEEARRQRFIVQRTPTGILTVPLSPLDQPYTPEQFAVLPDGQREELTAAGQKLQARVNDAMRRVRHVERATREALRNMERETGLFAVEHLVQGLKERYAAYEGVGEYLDKVQADMIEHLESIRGDGQTSSSLPQPLQTALGRRRADVFLRYEVNLLVDNGATEGAPVVVETNPTYYNLVGRVEYEGELGTVRTNFTMVKPGALHRANGGYLIIQARDLLMNSMAWPALKRALKTGEVRIENLAEQHGMVATTSLRPEAVPLDVKVILIGDPFIYQLLHHHDEDFRKFFKVRVDFDSVMPRTKENEHRYAAFICARCQKGHLPPFAPSAVARIVEYSSRLAGRQDQLSTRFNEITAMIDEAAMWARKDGVDTVEGRHVQRAVEAKAYRSNQVEERLFEMIERGALLVDVDGGKVGQINGIAVLHVGDYAFGKPVRITARTFLGGRGVVNIEREADLSGRIHSKGVFILSAFFGGTFAQDKPLALSASLAFEQSYDEVEGDSASAAELFALLSELSGLPIDQGIAVTGSVNQKGEMQPIGGVNEKIEGFYHVCKAKGLTGRQGVIIPRANVENLMLKDDVVEAVEQGRFHLWAVSRVEEGIEILTGRPAGKVDAAGRWPEDTVYGRVDARLRDMLRLQRQFLRGDGGTRPAAAAEGEDSDGEDRSEAPRRREGPEDEGTPRGVGGEGDVPTDPREGIGDPEKGVPDPDEGMPEPDEGVPDPTDSVSEQ